MNKSELVDAISKLTDLSKINVIKIIDAFTEISTKELKKGGEINLVGFLSMKKVKRSARIGRNPSTGKELKIPAKNIVKAKIGKTLQDAIN